MKIVKISERVLNILEWNNILDELDARCVTSAGKELILKLKPLSVVKVKSQQSEISEIKELIIKGEHPDFSGITDIEAIVDIAKKNGILTIDDLNRIKKFIIASNRIIAYIKKHKEERGKISTRFCNLNRVAELRDILISSITDNCELNSNKYTELGNIKEKIYSLKRDIENKLQQLIYSPAMSSALQEKIYTIRNERYVVLVKSNMKGKLKGTLHDLSSSGATLYIEPNEITGLNNKLIMLERDLKIEINKILRQLSNKTSQNSEELLYNKTLLAELDFITAASKFSISIKGNEIEITDDFVIQLYNARHPLLYLMSPDKVIPNDISIGKDFKCMIISGANTGGKTVLLKTIGLCALLTMYGLHVPASADSSISVFSNILADIGDDQSIVQSLSTYSGQIVIINEMIQNANKESLILIDEILVGTNPRQGAVLAQAILEALAATEAIMIVTTHYSELKELPSIENRFQNASVSFDLETLKPTYRLSSGIPGTSFAIEIARAYGMAENIIKRSKELLDSREITTEALIESIQKNKAEIEEDREKIKILQKKLTMEIDKYNELQSKLKLRAENLKHEKGIEFIEEINQYRNTLNKKIQETSKFNIAELNSLKQDLKTIQNKVSKKLKDNTKERFLNKYVPFNANKAKIGDLVFIAPLEKTGKIDSINISNEEVVIILGNSIRTRYKFTNLLMGAGSQKEKKIIPDKKVNKFLTRQSNTIEKTIQTQYNTSDLRGLKVDEAIIKLEQDLDKMIRTGVNSAVVIHGHGTGALKKAVRIRLKDSFYVKNFRSGEYGEGGDGVSIVLLKD